MTAWPQRVGSILPEGERLPAKLSAVPAPQLPRYHLSREGREGLLCCLHRLCRPGAQRAGCHPGILPEEGNSNVRGILRGEAVSANRPASAVRAGARITVLNSTNSYEILRVFFPLLAQWFTLLCSLVFTTPFSCVYYPVLLCLLPRSLVFTTPRIKCHDRG